MFLLTVLRRFLCCSSSLFVCWSFHIWCLLCPYLFLISPYFGPSRRLCLVTITLPEYESSLIILHMKNIYIFFRLECSHVSPQWVLLITYPLLNSSNLLTVYKTNYNLKYFICDLFIINRYFAALYSCMKVCCTTMEAEGEGWAPIKSTYALLPCNLLLTVPRWYFRCGSFSYMFWYLPFTNVFLLTIVYV